MGNRATVIEWSQMNPNTLQALTTLAEFGPIEDWPTLIWSTPELSAVDLLRLMTLIVDDAQSTDPPDPGLQEWVDHFIAQRRIIKALTRAHGCRVIGRQLLFKLSGKARRGVDTILALPAEGAQWNPNEAEKTVQMLKSPHATAVWLVEECNLSSTLVVQKGTFHTFDDGLWDSEDDVVAAHYIWFRGILQHLPAKLASVGLTNETYQIFCKEVNEQAVLVKNLKSDEDASRKDLNTAERSLRNAKESLNLFDKELLPLLEGGLERREFPKIVAAIKGRTTMQIDSSAFDAAPLIVVTPSYAIDFDKALVRLTDGDSLKDTFVDRNSLAHRYLTKSTTVDPLMDTYYAERNHGRDAFWWLTNNAPRFLQLLRYQWGDVTINEDTDDDLRVMLDPSFWEQVEALQRVLGYLMLGAQTAKASFALIGKANTGKSTLAKAIAQIMGEYCSQPDSSVLFPTRGETVRPEDLVKIYGARLAILSEIPNTPIDAGVWKSLTGGDKITFRRLYQQAVEWYAETKILFVGNNPPIVPNDAASRHRFIAIPFLRPVIAPDPSFDTALRREAPAILRWVLEGAYNWQFATTIDNDTPQEALLIPDRWLTYSDHLIEEADPFIEFFTDWVVDDDGFEPFTKLFQLFEVWCSHNGRKPPTSTAFGRLLKARDFEKSRRGENQAVHYRAAIRSTHPDVSLALNKIRAA